MVLPDSCSSVGTSLTPEGRVPDGIEDQCRLVWVNVEETQGARHPTFDAPVLA